MCVPSPFRVEDPSTIQALIRENSFGTLVSSDGGVPMATHLPFLLRSSGESLELAGHLARANPQTKALLGGTEVIAVFQGPHAYISPRWYTTGTVPTWNYQSVHCYGTPTIISDPGELYGLLHELVSFHEQGQDSPFRLEELITQAAARSTSPVRRELDIGCGAGNNTIKLAEVAAPFEVDLLDLSQPMARPSSATGCCRLRLDGGLGDAAQPVCFAQ